MEEIEKREKTFPEEIHLQFDGDSYLGEQIEGAEVTWAENKINENDVKYFRADLIEEEKKKAVEKYANWLDNNPVFDDNDFLNKANILWEIYLYQEEKK